MGISLTPVYTADLMKSPDLPTVPHPEDATGEQYEDSRAAWDAWREAYRPFVDDFRIGGYFAFNWSAAEAIVAALASEGVLDESPEPEWPDELIDEMNTDDYADGRSEGSDALWDFLARTPYPGGFYAYKFGSNDGWIVTPDECRTISGAIRRYLGQEDLHETAEWIAFLTRFAEYCEWCVERGGFRVN